MLSRRSTKWTDGTMRADVAENTEAEGKPYQFKKWYKYCIGGPPLGFYCIWIFLLAMSLLSLGSAAQQRRPGSFESLLLKEKLILDAIFDPGNYDRRIRPAAYNETAGPVLVYVNIMLRDVQEISDVNMDYTIQVTFRQQWMDRRLSFDSMGGKIQYLTLTDPGMIWMPDLFFKNEKEGHFHNIILPNMYIRINPDGGILYSIRLSLKLACPMDLKDFPFDRQSCPLLLASYSRTTEDLVFLWKDVEPVQVSRNLHLPRLTLEKFITDYCNSRTITGAYSCLKVGLVFKREFSYYLTEYYIPCCMLVIISWVSFWLDQSAAPARVSLGVITVLMMSMLTSNMHSALPPVSYTKAIDVWTAVCLTFVFGALLEYAFVNHASRSDERRENAKKHRPHLEMQLGNNEEATIRSDEVDGGSSDFPMKPLESGDAEGKMHMAPLRRVASKVWPSKFRTSCSYRIDVISRIVFPLVFAIFNIAYWSANL